MSEEFKPYNLEKAQEEAEKMREKIEKGEAKNYKEAAKLVDGISKPKSDNVEVVLTPEQKKMKEEIMHALIRCVDYPNGASDAIGNIQLSKEIIDLPEVQQRIYKTLNTLFYDTTIKRDVRGHAVGLEKERRPDFKSIELLQKKLNISNELIQKVALVRIQDYLYNTIVSSDPRTNDINNQSDIRSIATKFLPKEVFKEFIDNPKTKEDAKHAIIRTMSDFNFGRTTFLKNFFDLPEDYTEEEGKKIIEKQLAKNLLDVFGIQRQKDYRSLKTEDTSKYRIFLAQRMEKDLLHAEDFFGSEIEKIELTESDRESLKNRISEDLLYSPSSSKKILDIVEPLMKNKFDLPENFIDKIIYDQVTNHLIWENISGGKSGGKTREEIINLSKGFINSPEFQDRVKDRLIKIISKDYTKNKYDKYHGMYEGHSEDPISPREFFSPVIREFHISKDTIQSPEVETPAKDLFIKMLRDAQSVDQTFQLVDIFLLDVKEMIKDTEVQNAAKERLLNIFLNDSYSEKILDRSTRISKKISLTEDIIKSPEIQKAAKIGLFKTLFGFGEYFRGEGRVYYRPDDRQLMNQCAIKDGFAIPPDFERKWNINSPKYKRMQEEANPYWGERNKETLSRRDPFKMPELIELKKQISEFSEIFSLSKEDINKIATKAILYHIYEGDIRMSEVINKITRDLGISAEAFDTPENDKLIKEMILSISESENEIARLTKIENALSQHLKLPDNYFEKIYNTKK